MMRTWERVALLAILLTAFGLRVWRLDSQELRGDEAFGYFFSLSAPMTIVKHTLDLGEPHPVASYWLQHGWLRLAGDDEFALRWVSVWWNVLAVALSAQLAFTLGMSRRTGIIGAVLLAISPYALWHAQDARMYSMSLALTSAAVIAAVRWWTRPHAALAALYLACAFAALHTHYYAGFVPVVLAPAGLVRSYPRWGRQGALRWLAIQGGLVLLYLPWLMRALPVVNVYGGNGDSPGLGNAIVRTLAAMVLGEVDLPPGRVVWAGVLAVAMALGAAGLVRSGGDARRSAWLLMLYAVVPFAAIWLSARTRPIFDERYLVTIVPPLYLLAAESVHFRLSRRAMNWPAIVPLALVTAAMGLSTVSALTNPVYSKNRGWRELAQQLDKQSAGFAAEDVRLIQNYPDPTLWYYYRGPVAHLVLPPAAHDAVGAALLVDELASAGVRRVVLVDQPSAGWDDEGIARASLEETYTPISQRTLGDWSVVVLERPGPLMPMAVQYVNGLQLTAASVTPQPAAWGATLAAHLRLDAADAVLSGTEKISVQVVDGRGDLIAQVDAPLATAIQATGAPSSYGILMPQSVTGAAVTVNLVIYDPAQAEMARILTVEGQDVVKLATLMTSPMSPAATDGRHEINDAGTP